MRAISDDVFAAITIYAEAEGESHAGKVAIGEVIRERARTRFFSDGTIIGTCFARMQFSEWDDDRQDNLRAIKVLQVDDQDPVYLDCLAAWQESATSNTVPGAVQYFNPDQASPSWATDGEFVPVAQVDHHLFLKKAA